jgi:methionyl-tRNA formyltransferase
MRPNLLKLAFMGTPDFAVTALDALVEAGHEIAAVYTQPPRPANRGRLTPSPVQLRAEALGLPVRSPETLKGKAEQADFAALDLDVAVVAAYGLLLPRAVLDAPRLGCLNIHASLLPRWRGAAPIQRAILAGDAQTGVTIMQMEQGLDTGPMLLSGALPIGHETAGELTAMLAALGARLMVETLATLPRSATPQPDEGVTTARKIDKAEARIDWALPAVQLDRLVRAMQPSPGAWFESWGIRVKLIAAEPASGDGTAIPQRDGPAGTLLDGATIATGDGCLRLLAVQPEGKPRMPAADWLRGRRMAPGDPL